VPSRVLTVTPQLPAEWGEITLHRLRLGAATVDITASETTSRTEGLSDDWRTESRSVQPLRAASR
jgi:hypothetical protein